MKVSPHTHCESPLTGSTIDNLIKRAKELGRTHFAYTDHGHLSSCLKTYTKVKKAGLKFIPGIEFYFKDSSCPIIGNTSANRCKYFTATLYCEDAEAYKELCRLVSRTDMATIDIYEEKQQLWTWKELEHMAKFKTNLVLGGVHCMVGKVMLAGAPDLAERVLNQLHHFFKDLLYTSIICEPWTKKYNSLIEIIYLDGSKDVCLSNDFVTTNRARRIKALDLYEKSGHLLVKSLNANNTYKDVNKEIKEVKLHKGFLPLPGGDVTLKINKFLKALSKKHGLMSLVSDYAYYANKDDKIVQTMRLEGTNKLQPNLHMKDAEEISQYLIHTLGVSTTEEWDFYKNNEAWAARFDGLVLKYEWRLADSGADPLKQAMEIIRQNGRMKWDDPKYVARLREELEVIAKNPKKDLTPYFLPIRSVLNHYTENGLLVGPGRGSAGGSLF